MTSAVFDDPRDDRLDIFATSHSTIDDNYDAVLTEAIYIGWLSSKDFRFLDALVTELRAADVAFDYFTTTIVLLGDIRRIGEYLTDFVVAKNKVSRTDQEANRSVMRLRAIIDFATRHQTNLLLVAD